MGATARQRTGNLPAELNRLIGRRNESAEARQLLSAARVVTLTGTGGVGKTRLALHVARQAYRSFPGGTWLVALTQPDLLPMTVLFLGLAAFLNDDTPRAAALVADGLTRKRAIDDLLGIGVAVELLAWTALAAQDTERAAMLFGAAGRAAEPLGAHLGGFHRMLEWHDRYVRQARDILGARAYDRAVSRGHDLSLDEAIRYALGEKPASDRPLADGEHLPLTPRERQIAELIAAGHTNKQAAGELVVALRTVDTHVEKILRKLGFTSRSQVAALFAGHLPRQPRR